MYQKKEENNKFLILGIIAIILIFGKNIISYIKSIFSEAKAKNQVPELQNETNQETPQQVQTDIRINFVKSIATTVHDLLKSFIQDEKLIVDTMNTLNNPKEVSFISSYYQDQYNKSLASELKNELMKDVFYWSTEGKRFTDLKKFIQDNLV